MKVRAHRNRRFRLIRALALGLAVAAAAAPSALGDPIDRYLQQQERTGPIADASDRGEALVQKFVPFVTDFGRVSGTGHENVPAYGLPRPSAADYAAYLASIRTDASSGLNWSHAAVGVGIGVAGCLALLALAVVGRSRMRPAHS